MPFPPLLTIPIPTDADTMDGPNRFGFGFYKLTVERPLLPHLMPQTNVVKDDA